MDFGLKVVVLIVEASAEMVVVMFLLVAIETAKVDLEVAVLVLGVVVVFACIVTREMAFSWDLDVMFPLAVVTVPVK